MVIRISYMYIMSNVICHIYIYTCTWAASWHWRKSTWKKRFWIDWVYIPMFWTNWDVHDDNTLLVFSPGTVESIPERSQSRLRFITEQFWYTLLCYELVNPTIKISIYRWCDSGLVSNNQLAAQFTIYSDCRGEILKKNLGRLPERSAFECRWWGWGWGFRGDGALNAGLCRRRAGSVRHDSFMCVTWLVHVCDMTHSCVWHDLFRRAAWLDHMRNMTHWDARDMNHSDARDMTHWDVWNMTHSDGWDMTHSDGWDMTHSDVWDMTHSNVWDMTHSDVRDMSHSDVSDMTHSDVR